MKTNNRDFWIKISLPLIAVSLSMFLLGAGANQVTTERSDRHISRTNEIEKWNRILEKMSTEIPEKYRKEWIQLMKKNPEKLFKTVSMSHKIKIK